MAAFVLAVSLVPVLAGMSRADATQADPSALLTWTRLAPQVSPPARVDPAMAFDAANDTTVLFGGRSGSTLLGDTWTWNGSTWTAQDPANSPQPLESASMAYDSAGNRILLFGGIGANGASGQTWAWDGSTWTQLAVAPPSSPSPRYSASMVADAATGTDVLFGGLSSPGSYLGDTWSWNGTSWTNLNPAKSPPPRSAAAATFDAARGVVVLFGGMTGSSNLADTWTWDGTTWTEQLTPIAPPARSDAAFGFDPGTQTSVLFGGTGATGTNVVLGDTWLWNGSTWLTSLPLSLLPFLSPQARMGPAIAAAPSPERLVLFGGQSGGANLSSLGDTWTVGTVLATRRPPSSTTTPGTATTSTTTVAGSTTTTSTAPATAATGPVTSAPSPPEPTAVRPPAPSPLGVATRLVHRGALVRVSGGGFLPGATITITFHSARVVVGTTVADAEGRFSTMVLVPADAALGQHHIEANGRARNGEPATLVAQVSIATPKAKRSWLLPALMVALTVLVAAGAGVVLTASARWRHHRPAA